MYPRDGHTLHPTQWLQAQTCTWDDPNAGSPEGAPPQAGQTYPQQSSARPGDPGTCDQGPLLDLDAALAHSWQTISRSAPPPKTSGQAGVLLEAEQTSTQLVRQLWTMRALLKDSARQLLARQSEAFLADMWQGWRYVCLLQRTQRELRRRGRQRKVAQVVAAVEADNVFQAAKQFAPKTRRRRLQLRAEKGEIQTHEEEFRDILEYFRKLYRLCLPARHRRLCGRPSRLD